MSGFESESHRSKEDACSSRTKSGHSNRSPRSSPRVTEEPLNDLLEITVNTVMEGVTAAKILVPALCRVSELKSIVSDATDISAGKQVLMYKDVELKDDNTPIRSYGIDHDCTITMNVRMSTGSKIARDNSLNMNMFFLPMVMRQGSTSSLRSKIRSMTSIRSRPKYSHRYDLPKYDNSLSSPAKQMEHELTRNKMMRLLRKVRQRKTRLLSDTDVPSPESHSSISPNSPTSPNIPAPTPSPLKTYEPDKFLTDRHMKLFFDPPESVEEMMLLQSPMSLPPSSVEELLQIKEARKKSTKTACQFCHRKLGLTEQQIECLCHGIFCKKHRRPAAHNCGIDYKQTGRSKIIRENPRILEGGIHKARED
ncbi:unnamed protein product [Cylicocyclus nassatus]|uniref:AN1-type zinc finger protein 4 n=1 Tax=Cylicocyclus nassatus TaxID=53992 RepID=A0AA36GZ11_CYLNA|nr:unnamed protein product [Cylicocyclus nassatus]